MTDRFANRFRRCSMANCPTTRSDCSCGASNVIPSSRAFGSYALIGETLRAPGGTTREPRRSRRGSRPYSADGDTARSGGARRRTRGGARAGCKPAAAVALAASAAFAAVLLMRPAIRPERWRRWPTSMRVRRHRGIRGGRQREPTPAQSQRLAGYMVAHSQFSTPMVRRNVWTSLLAADPGIARVAYETAEGTLNETGAAGVRPVPGGGAAARPRRRRRTKPGPGSNACLKRSRPQVRRPVHARTPARPRRCASCTASRRPKQPRATRVARRQRPRNRPHAAKRSTPTCPIAASCSSSRAPTMARC